MVSDKIQNHVVYAPGIYVELRSEDGVRRLGIRTLARLLGGKKFIILQQPVFEVVDTKLRCLPEADRAQVASDLCPSLVRGRDRSREFVCSYEVVGFEIVDSFIEPIIHGSGRIFRSRELVKL